MDPPRILFLLLFFGSAAAGSLAGETLDCTNNYDGVMSCNFKAQKCSEYRLTLANDQQYETKDCELKSDAGSCNCSVSVKLVPYESFTARLQKGNRSVTNKTIPVIKSVKPKPPILSPVKELNGNFLINWRSNMEGHINSDLTAYVTYYKKGDRGKVSAKSITVEGKTYYDILGKDLDPSTTYVVSVKNFINWSHKFSESSGEEEFTTAASSTMIWLPVIIGLSVASVLISVAIYVTYVKFQKWWDKIAKYSNPKNLDLHPSEQKILKPGVDPISSVCVEPLDPDDSTSWSKGTLRDSSSGSPQHSSGISSGSSGLSYANTEPLDIKGEIQNALNKAFANISPMSPSDTNPSPYNPCFEPADTMRPGSGGFDNKTYSILLPSCPVQMNTDSHEVQTQAAMLCDSSYQPVQTGASPHQEAPVCPFVNSSPAVPSLLTVDMSYQQCAVSSGEVSNAEDSGLSSLSSGNTIAPFDPTSRVKCEPESIEMVVDVVCDENPCYRQVPANLPSFLPVDSDYQAFQSLVQQPDASLPEERSAEEEEDESKYGEGSFGKMPQSFFCPLVPGLMNNVHSSDCLQSPFLPATAAESTPVITDGYQCV